MAFADHFSGRAAEYAVHRPTYPPGFIAYLAGLSRTRQLAWDVGTGNGQAAVLLAEHFARVVATDASADQIANATQHPRVSYGVAVEDASGLGDASADLVTVAQALHWFDRGRFYTEARRVLRPDGAIAVWCYGRLVVEGVAGPVVERFYVERVMPYWPRERHHVETLFREIDFPFKEVPVEGWAMSASLSRHGLLGYVGTWSAVVQARRDGIDLVLELGDALNGVWPEDPSDQRLVRWPIGLRVGRVG
jgi:SAM-dependent methyltransferase